MAKLRQIPLSLYVAIALLGLSVWASDIRGLYLAVALLAVVAAQMHQARSSARRPRPDLLSRAGSGGSWAKLDVVLAPFVWIVLVMGLVDGGLYGWAAAGNVIASVGAAAMGGAVALLLLGVMSILVATVSALFRPALSHDDDSSTERSI